MAGDWLKLRTRLHEEPAVIRLAELTGLDVFGVVGRLAVFWGWAGEHTVTGELRCVTLAVINARVAHENFAEAMCRVGWLEIIDDQSVRIPRWKDYNAKSSKERSLAAERASRYREKKSRSPSRAHSDATVTNHASREEKRREEKSREENTRKKAAPFDAKLIPIPEILQTPEFLAAWHQWVDARAENGKRMTERAGKMQLDKLATFGPGVAVQAIAAAISNQWQGLFPEKIKSGHIGNAGVSGNPLFAGLEESRARRAAND